MKIKNLKNKIPRPPVYGNKTLKIAFEFGLILSETAKKMKVEVTPEIAARAEEILINELKIKGMKKTGLRFIPLIMAALELR